MDGRFYRCINDGNETTILDATLERMELKVASRLNPIHSPTSGADSNSIQFVEEDITEKSSTPKRANEENQEEPSTKGGDPVAVLHYTLHLLL